MGRTFRKMPVVYEVETMNQRSIDPYEELANAIVIQAINDYKAVKSGRIPTITEEEQINMSAEDVMLKLHAVKQEIIKFINSEWFSTLTDLNATAVIEKLQKTKTPKWKPRLKYVQFDYEKCELIAKEQELTYKDMVKLTGISGKILFNMFKRKRKYIKHTTAEKIEAALGLEQGNLVLGEYK